MSTRFSAARPKRAGESFARTLHGEEDDGQPASSKRVKFDVRNPSALAPDRDDADIDQDDEAVLDADVIGKGPGATKRGAVNIDGYDSDSDNDNINIRAEERHRTKTGDVDIGKQFAAYDGSGPAGNRKAKPAGDDDDDDDDDDMEEVS